MSHTLLSSFALVFVAATGACCSSQRTPEPTPVPNEVVTEPREGAPHETLLAAPPELDCSQPPDLKCCRAMTPKCIQCSKEAQAQMDEWDAQCGPAPSEPLPATFDCQAPPPLRPCCKALLPKCRQCVERNRAIEEAYRAQCGPG